MFYTALVTVNELSTEVTIDFMEVETMVSCYQGFYKFDVLSDLVNVSGSSWIVSRGLYATAQGIVALKSHYIVSLPAM